MDPIVREIEIKQFRLRDFLDIADSIVREVDMLYATVTKLLEITCKYCNWFFAPPRKSIDSILFCDAFKLTKKSSRTTSLISLISLRERLTSLKCL